MLLLFRASGNAEAFVDLRVGLTAVATATATFGLSIGLTPPTSGELHVSVTPNITIGLNGNNIPTSNGIAALTHVIGLTALPGYAASTAFSTTFELSGTVGSFFDGQATIAHTLGLSGDAHPLTDASFDIDVEIGGLPEITGGTIESAAVPGVVLELQAYAGYAVNVFEDIRLDLNAAAIALPGVNLDATLLDKRPRTTLRSFLIGN